jgi:hypothetical protein
MATAEVLFGTAAMVVDGSTPQEFSSRSGVSRNMFRSNFLAAAGAGATLAQGDTRTAGTTSVPGLLITGATLRIVAIVVGAGAAAAGVLVTWWPPLRAWRGASDG